MADPNPITRATSCTPYPDPASPPEEACPADACPANAHPANAASAPDAPPANAADAQPQVAAEAAAQVVTDAPAQEVTEAASQLRTNEIAHALSVAWTEAALAARSDVQQTIQPDTLRYLEEAERSANATLRKVAARVRAKLGLPPAQKG
jgi:hypothetical protein